MLTLAGVAVTVGVALVGIVLRRLATGFAAGFY
jgi:hypothetical protein